MAIKAKTANSTFTAADWATVDATLYADAATNSNPQLVPTTWGGVSGAGLAGGITVDGIFVKVSARVASPVGTFSVRLYNVTTAAVVAGTTVTINVSDLPATLDPNAASWTFFKFGAPVALAAQTFRVETIVSTTGEVTLWKATSSTNNWCRGVRTTTLTAPGAGDTLWICSEWTGAGANTPRAVTMDSTATTDYGDGAEAGYPQLLIGDRATLTWGTSAATNYRLRLSGILQVAPGGTMRMGTTGTPCPRDSTMELQFDQVTTNGAYYLHNFGTLSLQGQSRTAGKNVWYTDLTATSIAAATTHNVADDTGWLSGDRVIMSGTARAANQSEVLTLDGNAGATSFVSTAGLANTHNGTGTVIARIHLLTRNVRIAIGGTATKAPGGIRTSGQGNTDCDWAAVRSVAGTGVGNGNGISDTATATYDFCCVAGDVGAVTSTSHYGFTIPAAAAFLGTLSIADSFFGGQIVATSGTLFYIATLTGGSRIFPALTMARVHFDSSDSDEDGCSILSTFGAWSDIWCSGTVNAFTVGASDSPDVVLPPFSLDGLVSQSGGAISFGGVGHGLGVVKDVSLLRCNSTAGLLTSTGVVIDGLLAVGNASPHVQHNGKRPLNLRNATIKAETGFAANYAIAMSGPVVCENVTFGGAGAGEAMSSAEINLTSTSDEARFLTFINCTFTAPSRVVGQSTSVISSQESYFAYQRENGVTGVHYKQYPWLGYVRYETTMFRTAAPSERLQLGGSLASVASATTPLRSTPRNFAIRSGHKLTIGVYVRKDSTYDGTQPRLICESNGAIGHDSRVVAATMAGGTENWELLTATLPSAIAEEDGILTCWVEADGSTGNVYVDDWSASEV